MAAAVMLGGLIPVRTGRAQVITETFKNSTAPGWVFSGSGYTPTLTSGTAGADGNAAGDGWLRLTTPGNNQATSAYYNTAFTAANATIFAKFDYESYGGSGADGITFFLFDGAVPFSVGAHGGSLGYAQKTTAGGAEYDHAGLAGGYLGIALDEYGNFSSASEGRVGGLNGTTGLVPDAIAVRGPGSGYDGYAYLGGSGTLAQSIDSATRPSQTNTVQMLLSATNQLTITLQQGGTSPQTVLYMDLSGYARPETLKFGFSSGTGGLTNYHDVRNLNVTALTANLWSGGSGDGLWATNNNWDPTIVPNIGADILFDNTHVTSVQNITVGANRNVRSLTFDSPHAYTLTGSTLTFDNQGVPSFSGIAVSQTHGTSTTTINSAVSMNNDIYMRNNSTGALSIAGAIDTNGHTLTLDGTGTSSTLSGVISDTGGIVKNDSGTFTLTGNNTYTGGTTVNNGRINIGHDNGFGAGSSLITLNGGSIGSSTTGINFDNDVELAGNGGIYDLTLDSGASVTQSGGSHTLVVSNSTLNGTLNMGGGTLTVQGEGTSTIAGVVSNGGLTKTGSGTLVVSGNNTYTGDTTITEGSLRLGNNNRLNDGTDVSIGASGVLELNGFDERIGNLTALAGGATIDYGTSGNADLLFDTYTGPPSGVLVINNFVNGTDRLATTINGQDVSTIYFSGYGVAEYNGTANLFGNSRYLLRPDLAGSKEWDGSSSSTWSTNQNWTNSGEPSSTQVALFDDLGVDNNRLNPNLNGDDTIAGIRFGTNADGSYRLEGHDVVDSDRTLTLAGAVPYVQQQSAFNQEIAIDRLALGNNTVMDITAAGNLTVSSAIHSSSNFIKDGTGAGKLILTADNSNLTGQVFVNNGVLQAAHNNALGTNNVTIAGGATLELAGAVNVANAVSVSGTGVGGTGAILAATTSGNTTSTLAGAVTLTGATTVGATATNTLALGAVNGTNQNLATTGAGDVNLTGAIATGTGTLTAGGSGVVTMSGAANTYTGTTTVNGGTLVLNKAAGTTALAGNLTVNAGTVRLDASNQIANTSTVTLNNSATLNLNGRTETLGQLNSASATAVTALGTGGALTLNGPNNSNSSYAGTITGDGSSSVTVAGTGKVYLSGNNSAYAGTTTVSSGTLNASGSNNVLGTGSVAVNTGGTLQVQGGINLANAITINGAGTTVNGAIQNFAGNNTLSGDINVAGDARVQSDTGNLTLAGNITAGAHELTVGGVGQTTLGGTLGGTGLLTKEDSGTLLVTSNLDFGGDLALEGGVLQFNVDNAFADTVTLNSGTLRLSSLADLTIGTLNITGNTTIDFAGTANILNVTNFNISADVQLTILNWQDAADYFFAENWNGAAYDASGATPMNQVAFHADGNPNSTTYNSGQTKWQSFDDQITPVPEPSTYGAMLMGAGLAFFGWRRWRGKRPAAV